MLSRALSLATVTLLIGCFAGGAAHAQATNLEAGKSPSQIFAGTCTACHKGPRGLLKTVPASSLPGYLRQHYTTSSDMASVLASFLVSKGATDTRYQGKDQPKTDQAKGAKQEAAKPDAVGVTPPGDGAARPGREGRRLARPGQPPDDTKPADGQAPVQAATDGKTGAKQKLGKRGRRGTEEPPKSDEAAKEEAARRETAKVDAGKGEVEKRDSAKPAGEAKPEADKPEADKPETGKPETGKAEPAKSEPAKSETAKVDAPRETGGSEPTPLRPDPVPPVTPAPPASATTASTTPEPAASPPASAAAPAQPPAPPAVTASAPPSPPVAPAGPPAPPISQ
jgi:hypothetical protein